MTGNDDCDLLTLTKFERLRRLQDAVRPRSKLRPDAHMQRNTSLVTPTTGAERFELIRQAPLSSLVRRARSRFKGRSAVNQAPGRMKQGRMKQKVPWWRFRLRWKRRSSVSASEGENRATCLLRSQGGGAQTALVHSLGVSPTTRAACVESWRRCSTNHRRNAHR